MISDLMDEYGEVLAEGVGAALILSLLVAAGTMIIVIKKKFN